MRLKLNRAAALTLTGTAILATLSQVGGAAPRSYIEGQNYKNNNGEQVKADDLDSVTDPSKLSESDFAPGTKWTNAGWTTTQYPTALQSNTQIDIKKMSIFGSDAKSSIKIDATLDKNTLKKGNTILLSSMQQLSPNKQKNPDERIPWTNMIYTSDTNIYFEGKKIGYITAEYKPLGSNPYYNQDHGQGYRLTNELDFMLHVTQDCDFASNPKISFQSMPNSLSFNEESDIHEYRPFKNIEFPAKYRVITANKIYTYELNDTHDDFVVPDDRKDNSNVWVDAQHNAYGFSAYVMNNRIIHTIYKVIPSIRAYKADSRLYKITSLTSNKNVFNENGEMLSEGLEFNILLDQPISVKYQASNKSSIDLYNEAPNNSLTYNYNPDGSYYIITNIDLTKAYIDSDDLKSAINKTYYVNVQHKSDIDLIQQANLKDKSFGLVHYFDALPATQAGMNQNFLVNVINETPGQKSTIAQSTHVINSSTFNAELYRTALVHYFDSKTGNNISNDSIMGIKNNSTDYKLNIPKGYVLDTKSGKNKDGTQYKWSADKKSIAYTFNEDQKLNDANPINIYITHGTHNTNDNSGKSTRTIQYTGLPDNLKPKDNVQTVLFKRSGVTDDVSGETTYGDWQPQSGNGHYTAVTSPTFAGYKPDQEVIPDTAATPNKNETVTVNYSKTDQNAKLTVHDDTANTDLNDYAENSTGLYQDQINFKTAPSAVEQELKDKGYNIVSDSFKGSPTYNADDSKNNFVIHVTHKIVPVTPDQPKTPTDVIPDTKQHYPTGVDTNDLNKDVQRSIFYKYEDNTQAEPTVVQKAHFDRTVKVDAVTQKIVDNGTWATKDNYPEVATKSIDGYTPDKTKVDSATPSMTTNQDQTIVYHANDEDAAITYIDDTTGKVLKTDTQKAKYKQTIKFATDPNTQIQTYKDQGYVLVSSDWKDGSTYQTDPTKNKFTVHLKHGTSTVTPDKPKKPTDIIPGTKQHYPTGIDTNDLNQPQQRQITYTYADSKKQASPTVTQKATFHRTATVDNVTDKTTYTDWTTSDQYPEVKSPAIEGYTPDKQTVPATKPELNQKQNVAVTYNPNPETVDVIAQDNTGKQLSKSTLHGNYNTDYTATTPVIKGYHLIKMPTNTHGTYKTHNDPIIYIYAPDSNSVPEQTDGTPKPDKSSYPDDLTPAKRSNKLPETGSINLQSELKSEIIKAIHNLLK